jgi:hypothetical protein
MSILQSYPKGTPKKGDYIIGTSMPTAGSDEMPTTRNFSVDSIAGLGNAPNVVTATFTITTAQLETLGTTDVTLLPLAGGTGDGEYLQLISASILAGGGALGSSYTWDAAGAFISWSDAAVNNKIVIPQLQLPDGGGVLQQPYTIAASDGSYRRGGDLKLGTATDPVIVGTPNGTLTINLTYRLFP